MMSVYSMEPIFPEDNKHNLQDTCVDLISRASSLASRLHPILRTSMGDLVRSMNCYYSNLIEGHDTHPVNIDRALNGVYSNDKHQRNLQLKALAHIKVQRLIDAGNLPFPIVSEAFIKWLHKEFCSRLPEDLLYIQDDDAKKRIQVVAEEYRHVAVQVGRHVPVEAEMLPIFLKRFEASYGNISISKIQRMVGIAASHHRLLWIHPFLDGNGRVTRLFSHAFLKEAGVGSELWSVARGLARTVEEYKRRLMSADEPRRGDLDGRGNLTQSGLEEFCKYFLHTCIDQIDFMEKLLEPVELLRRMEIWAQEEVYAKRIPKGSWLLLREAVLAGEFSRGKVGNITGYEERQARTVLKELLNLGVLVSDGPRATIRLGFPTSILERWIPRLYPAF